MAGWVGASSELPAPLIEALRKHVLYASKIHADDTPVPALVPGVTLYSMIKTLAKWSERPSAPNEVFVGVVVSWFQDQLN
jgi:hypothetical protein